MKPEAWHAIIGVGLVCIGVGIIGSVAYVLYGPGFSLSFLTDSGAIQLNAQEYMCSDSTVVTVTFNNERANVMLGGEATEVVHTPVPEGVEVPPDAWDRYASGDASFVLWKRGNTVLVQQNGVVTHGECQAAQ